MEPFRLDRQAKAFLAVLVIIALALVPLAPFASLAFGALSLVVLCVVFLIALARNRRLFGPLTPAEGALAASSAVFALGGALVVVYAILMLGTGNAMLLSHAMLPFSSTGDAERVRRLADREGHQARDGEARGPGLDLLGRRREPRARVHDRPLSPGYKVRVLYLADDPSSSYLNDNYKAWAGAGWMGVGLFVWLVVGAFVRWEIKQARKNTQ